MTENKDIIKTTRLRKREEHKQGRESMRRWEYEKEKRKEKKSTVIAGGRA